MNISQPPGDSGAVAVLRRLLPVVLQIQLFQYNAGLSAIASSLLEQQTPQRMSQGNLCERTTKFSSGAGWKEGMPRKVVEPARVLERLVRPGIPSS